MDRAALSSRILALRGELEAAGVTHLALFGSRARGDHRPDSDLDVLIDIDGVRKFSLLDLIGVEHRIGDEIGLPVQATMRRGLSQSFTKAIAPDVFEIF